MKNSKIIDAYDSIHIGEESRERVRAKLEMQEGDGISEQGRGKLFRLRGAAVAAAILAVVLAGGITAFAMWNYLTPSQVAEKMGDQRLADAFESKDAVRIGETQSFGNYSVTLIGLISGEQLTDFPMKSDGEIQSDRTYCAVAIRKKKGTFVLGESVGATDFLASPLIQGQDPRRVNIFTMSGGSMGCVEDGVLYRIVDCDDLSAFADHKIYLAVTEGASPPSVCLQKNGKPIVDENIEDAGTKEAYIFDKASGEISRNEKYTGMNALFTLPIDQSLADADKAAELLKEWMGPDEEDTGEDEAGDDTLKRYAHLPAEEIKKQFTEVEGSEQTIWPDEDGMLCYSWESDEAGGCKGETPMSVVFPADDSKPGDLFMEGVSVSGSEGDLVYSTTLLELNEDGSVTVRGYYKKKDR